ncbi:MAG: histidine ammonia-lyase [Bacteroidales bacterium]|nr:histidine ammonia-lyase [Bacteroidales bacterium]
MKTHYISTKHLSFDDLQSIIDHKLSLALSEEAELKISKCRAYLDQKMKAETKPIYGINTGFGSLYNKSISGENLAQLQKNLVMSHACGLGDEVPSEIVKLMLLLKIQSVAYGHSGVQLKSTQRLIDFYNHDIIPVVYQQGSLGASGDLAPLAHLTLPILGLGEVYYRGEKQSTAKVYQQLGWDAIELQSKEGLAFLNGTQFMSAYASYLILKANKLSKWADIIGTVSLEAYDGRKEAFFPQVHQVRPHQGQVDTAANILKFLEGSELIDQHKEHVQDPYSFRCMPQVHGASKDALSYVASVVLKEINSVTDNPTIFPDEDLIISAGNFHGQHLALAMDMLGIALAELGNISERRTYQLIGGKRGLPSFLVSNPGLNSGFMIPQYAAASIVSQNKQLASPASVDSIESSQGQEDHVSMGANAATKAYKIAENLDKIFAIELMNASQALEFRRPLKSSPFVENLLIDYRSKVSLVENDEMMYPKIQESINFINEYSI